MANPAAFLAVTTGRLALNVATAAHRRYESFVDPQLFEPVRLGDDPESSAENERDIEQAISLLVRKLTPPELTAFLLRKSFDYPYARIAAILGVRSDNARQLVSRAQRGICARSDRQAEPEAARRLSSAFRVAARTGHVGVLERELRTLLDADPIRPRSVKTSNRPGMTG